MAVPSDIVLRRLRKLPEISFQEELRGYSKQQVDRVLESLIPAAEEIEALHQRLAEAETRAAAAEARLLELRNREPEPAPAPVPAVTPPADFDETLRNTLLLAQRTADETVRQAQENADRTTAEAAAEADRVVAEAAAEADRVVADARAEATRLERDIESRRAELNRDLDDERHRLMEEVRDELNRRRSVIEDELTRAEGTERAALTEEIAELYRARESLSADIEQLEGFLADRRSAIQSALNDLSMIVSDPQQLAGPGSPALSDVPAPTPAPPEVQVDAPTLDTLDHDLSERVAEATAPAPEPAVASAAAPIEPPAAPAEPTPAVALPEPVSELDPDDPFAGGVLLGEEADELGALADGLAGPSRVAAPIYAEPAATVDPPPDTPSPASADPFAKAQATTTATGADAAGGPAEPGIAPADVDATQEVDAIAEPPAAPASVPRPIWAESVPDADDFLAKPDAPQAVPDPFLDQLRRATGGEGAGPDDDDDALERFLEESDTDDRRSGWFGRRK